MCVIIVIVLISFCYELIVIWCVVSTISCWLLWALFPCGTGTSITTSRQGRDDALRQSNCRCRHRFMVESVNGQRCLIFFVLGTQTRKRPVKCRDGCTCYCGAGFVAMHSTDVAANHCFRHASRWCCYHSRFQSRRKCPCQLCALVMVFLFSLSSHGYTKARNRG